MKVKIDPACLTPEQQETDHAGLRAQGCHGQTQAFIKADLHAEARGVGRGAGSEAAGWMLMTASHLASHLALVLTLTASRPSRHPGHIRRQLQRAGLAQSQGGLAPPREGRAPGCSWG